MSEPRWNFLRIGATVTPRGYFLIGVLLALLKQVIDRMVSDRVFRRTWSPLSYAVTGEIGGLFSLRRDDQVFYATMLAVALPFLLVGLVLTVRRLRDAGWPLWLVLFFFAPMPINLVFFLVLCLTPSREQAAHGALGDVIDGPGAAKSGSKESRHRFSYSRAILAILIPLPVAAAAVYFGTHVLRDYGWSLFVGLPFVLPMISVLIYGYGREITQRDCAEPCHALVTDGHRPAGFNRLRWVDLHCHDAAARRARCDSRRPSRLFHPGAWTRPTPPSRQACDCVARSAADDGGRRTCRAAKALALHLRDFRGGRRPGRERLAACRQLLRSRPAKRLALPHWAGLPNSRRDRGDWRRAPSGAASSPQDRSSSRSRSGTNPGCCGSP